MYFDKSIDATALVLLTFLSSFAAPLVVWLLGPRGSLRFTTVPLALGTAFAVLFRAEMAELLGATIACVAGMWWFAIVASVTSDGEPAFDLRIAVPLALAGVLIVRALARTMPLDELPLWIAGPAVLALVVPLVFLRTPATLAWRTTDTRGGLALFALPLVFALAADVGSNGAVIAGAAGLASGPFGATSTYAGLAVSGLGVAAALLARRGPPSRPVIASAALVVGALGIWTRGELVSLVGGALLAFGIVRAATLLADVATRPARVPLRTTIALAFGWVTAILATLEYYVSAGAIVFFAGMVAVIAMLTVLSTTAAAAGRERRVPRLLAVCAALAIVAPTVTIVTSPAPTLVAPAGALRVMGYNIHLGYSDGDVPAIDAIAHVIAAESPDLVGLTEVTRGTIIAGGHDVLVLLAERLHMSYVFGPMLGDVEGVGVLSRVPIDELRVVPLARSSTAKDLRRVAVMVRIGTTWFVTTHLGGDDIPTQVGSIIAATSTFAHVVVTGDLNSEPGTPQMREFADAGFTDLGARDNALTFSPSALAMRIDYVWVRGLDGDAVRTVATRASDHLPVLTTVRLP